jgi:hypothetical protein
LDTLENRWFLGGSSERRNTTDDRRASFGGLVKREGEREEEDALGYIVQVSPK